MSDEATVLLREIRDLLRQQQPPPPESIPLTDFCSRLGRDIRWGYRQIAENRIFPDKSGKPYRVPISQLANFQ